MPNETLSSNSGPILVLVLVLVIVIESVEPVDHEHEHDYEKGKRPDKQQAEHTLAHSACPCC